MTDSKLKPSGDPDGRKRLLLRSVPFPQHLYKRRSKQLVEKPEKNCGERSPQKENPKPVPVAEPKEYNQSQATQTNFSSTIAKGNVNPRRTFLRSVVAPVSAYRHCSKPVTQASNVMTDEKPAIRPSIARELSQTIRRSSRMGHRKSEGTVIRPKRPASGEPVRVTPPALRSVAVTQKMHEHLSYLKGKPNLDKKTNVNSGESSKGIRKLTKQNKAARVSPTRKKRDRPLSDTRQKSSSYGLKVGQRHPPSRKLAEDINKNTCGIKTNALADKLQRSRRRAPVRVRVRDARVTETKKEGPPLSATTGVKSAPGRKVQRPGVRHTAAAVKASPAKKETPDSRVAAGKPSPSEESQRPGIRVTGGALRPLSPDKVQKPSVPATSGRMKPPSATMIHRRVSARRLKLLSPESIQMPTMRVPIGAERPPTAKVRKPGAPVTVGELKSMPARREAHCTRATIGTMMSAPASKEQPRIRSNASAVKPPPVKTKVILSSSSSSSYDSDSGWDSDSDSSGSYTSESSSDSSPQSEAERPPRNTTEGSKNVPKNNPTIASPSAPMKTSVSPIPNRNGGSMLTTRASAPIIRSIPKYSGQKRNSVGAIEKTFELQEVLSNMHESAQPSKRVRNESKDVNNRSFHSLSYAEQLAAHGQNVSAGGCVISNNNSSEGE